jgi:hypothetical protein
MNLRLSLALSAAFALTACSYSHGVYRTLSFGAEIADFSCIDTALTDLGYTTRLSEYGVEYSSESPKFDASFWYDEPGSSNKTVITHNASFGSPPAECSRVEAAADFINAIEPKVLAACNLNPIDTDQEISCAK